MSAKRARERERESENERGSESESESEIERESTGVDIGAARKLLLEPAWSAYSGSSRSFHRSGGLSLLVSIA